MKKFIYTLITIFFVLCLIGCDDSDVVNHNLNRDEQNFREYRRVVFYNGITGDYILQIEGFMALNIDADGDLVVTVKTNEGKYLKHYLGLSDNVTYFSESLDPLQVSDKNYKVIFKPSIILPTIEVQ
ncbi:MAG: hypothetical protein IIX47_07175 [Spirochaetaceae bacterium]|jgi:hypothetical protein|nr:hypothetical protein [Spirochaetaceae bacterium]